MNFDIEKNQELVSLYFIRKLHGKAFGYIFDNAATTQKPTSPFWIALTGILRIMIIPNHSPRHMH